MEASVGSKAIRVLMVLFLVTLMLTMEAIPNYFADSTELDEPYESALQISNTTIEREHPGIDPDVTARAEGLLDFEPRTTDREMYDMDWLAGQDITIEDGSPRPVPVSNITKVCAGIPLENLTQGSDLFLDYSIWTHCSGPGTNGTLTDISDFPAGSDQRPFVHPTLSLNITDPVSPLGGDPTPVDIDGDGQVDIEVEVTMDVWLDGMELVDDIASMIGLRSGSNDTRAGDPPSLTIANPLLDGQPVFRDIVVGGTVSDSDDIASVQLYLESLEGAPVPPELGSWQECTIITGPLGFVTTWSFDLGIGKLNNGPYRIHVRASDGTNWSEEETRDVNLINPNYGSRLQMKVTTTDACPTDIETNIIYPVPTMAGYCIVIGLILDGVTSPSNCTISLDPNIVTLENHILDWGGFSKLLTAGVAFQPLEGPFDIGWTIDGNVADLGFRAGLVDVRNGPVDAESTVLEVHPRSSGPAPSFGNIIVELDARVAVDGTLSKEFKALNWKCEKIVDLDLSIASFYSNTSLGIIGSVKNIPPNLTVDIINSSSPTAGSSIYDPYHTRIEVRGTHVTHFGPISLAVDSHDRYGGGNRTELYLEGIPVNMTIEVPMSFHSASTQVGSYHGFVDYLLRTMTQAVTDIFSMVATVPEKLGTSGYGLMEVKTLSGPIKDMDLLISSGPVLMPPDRFTGVLILNSSALPSPSIHFKFGGLNHLKMVSGRIGVELGISVDEKAQANGMRCISVDQHEGGPPDIMNVDLSNLPGELEMSSSTDPSHTFMDLVMDQRIDAVALGSGVHAEEGGRITMEVNVHDIPNVVHLTKLESDYEGETVETVDLAFEDPHTMTWGKPEIGSVKLALGNRDPEWLTEQSTAVVIDDYGTSITTQISGIGALNYVSNSSIANVDLSLSTTSGHRIYAYINESEQANATRVKAYVSRLPSRLQASAAVGDQMGGMDMEQGDVSMGTDEGINGAVGAFSTMAEMFRKVFTTIGNASVAMSESATPEGQSMDLTYEIKGRRGFDVVSSVDKGRGVGAYEDEDVLPLDAEDGFVHGLRALMVPANSSDPTSVQEGDAALRLYLADLPSKASISLAVSQESGHFDLKAEDYSPSHDSIAIDVVQANGSSLYAVVSNLTGSSEGMDVHMAGAFNFVEDLGKGTACNVLVDVDKARPAVFAQIHGTSESLEQVNATIDIPWVPGFVSESVVIGDTITLGHSAGSGIPSLMVQATASGEQVSQLDAHVVLTEVPPIIDMELFGLDAQTMQMDGMPDLDRLPGLEVVTSQPGMDLNALISAKLGDSSKEMTFIVQVHNLSRKVRMASEGYEYHIDVAGLDYGFISLRDLVISDELTVDRLEMELTNVTGLEMAIRLLGPMPSAVIEQMREGDVKICSRVQFALGPMTISPEMPSRLLRIRKTPIPIFVGASAMSRVMGLSGGDYVHIITPAPLALLISNFWWLILSLEMLLLGVALMLSMKKGQNGT